MEERAGGESRLPTEVAGYKSASASAPAIISIPLSHPPPPPPTPLHNAKLCRENNAICRDAVGRKLCRAAPGSAARLGPDKLCQGL